MRLLQVRIEVLNDAHLPHGHVIDDVPHLSEIDCIVSVEGGCAQSTRGRARAGKNRHIIAVEQRERPMDQVPAFAGRHNLPERAH